MRILFVAHGYPPSEVAGTERHVEALAQHARRRGHTVQVVAATRSPARKQYATFTEAVDGIEIVRVVNNVPTRSLAHLESDRVVDRVMARLQKDFRPDVVHLHHLQFLSSTTAWLAPLVVTLHDEWFWCAAGGLGIREDGTICSGPEPIECSSCAAAWRPTPGRGTRLLSSLAGRLSPVVSPERLHWMWDRVPQKLRPRPARGVGPASPPSAARNRNLAMARVLASARTVLSPSAHLADRCTEITETPVEVVRHGLDDFWFAGRADTPRTHVLFLGTIAAHKGPGQVVNAWRVACPDQRPPLRMHGPVQDPSLTKGHPIGSVLDRAGVRAALDGARVLVMGSTWPENAPLVVLEARARGCPVVAPSIGGLPELITHRDGRLFPPGDEDALAAALKSVLDVPAWSPRAPPTLARQADRILDTLDAARRQG